ncbi:Crp/Fnr family transcriptional regulator [Rhizosphaericola mali]|uniref:Crp/Fnr family transcriptional regulator n=1 Tax=Rhizosphaericola mali TaxID=2545455 RepID=A0A5P2FY82_9BACT|nr:Crp/Fnr family transcriptional regulator [Rhizosphaericola mali]QES88456.1 Crp/Fnr family transcriptional regulator [Rhizosphaericola mali]
MIVFDQYIKALLPTISENELQIFKSAGEFLKLRRKEKILTEGAIFSAKIYVQNGLLRNYSISDNGQEHIMKFTDAGSWTTDPESFYGGTPSKYNIEAIENSELILFEKEKFESLKTEIPIINALTESIISSTAQLNQNRLLLNLSATPEEKYIDFIQQYADIFPRIPMHMIASYLGISRETLTRVRQNLLVGR